MKSILINQSTPKIIIVDFYLCSQKRSLKQVQKRNQISLVGKILLEIILIAILMIITISKARFWVLIILISITIGINTISLSSRNFFFQLRIIRSFEIIALIFLIQNLLYSVYTIHLILNNIWCLISSLIIIRLYLIIRIQNNYLSKSTVEVVLVNPILFVCYFISLRKWLIIITFQTLLLILFLLVQLLIIQKVIPFILFYSFLLVLGVWLIYKVIILFTYKINLDFLNILLLIRSLYWV